MTTTTNPELSIDVALRAPAALPTFAALAHDPEEVRALIHSTLGGTIELKDLDRIKMPSGGSLSFTVTTPAGEEACRELVGVVLHVQRKRAYWPAEFSGSGTPPDCASGDGFVGVGDPGGDCLCCPLARFQDGERPACRETVDVAFLAPGDLLPTVLAVSPTSVRPVAKYLLSLTKKGLRHTDVVTRFGLERVTSQAGMVYARLTCTMLGPLDERQRQHMRALVGALAFDPAAAAGGTRSNPAVRTPGEDDVNIPEHATVDATLDTDQPPPGTDEDDVAS
jgi:hypothetical protein